MAIQYEINGSKVEFETEPSEQDIDEAASHLKGARPTAAEEQPAPQNIDEQILALENRPSKSGFSEIVPGLARGVVQGGQGILETGTNAADILAKLLTLNPEARSTVPGLNQQFLKESKQGLDQLIAPSETIMGKISEGVGQVPAMVATFENQAAKAVGAVPLAAGLGAVNAQEHGLGAMAGNAMLSAAQMRVLGAAQKMDLIRGALTGAAITGIPAALSGADGKDAIAQATLGAGFALFRPDTLPQLKEMFDTAHGISKNPRQTADMLMESLKTNPIEELKAKLENWERKNNEIEAKIAPAFADELRRKQEMAKAETEDQRQFLRDKRTEVDDAKAAYNETVDRDIRQATEGVQQAIVDLTKGVGESAVTATREIQDKSNLIQKQATDQYGAVFKESAKRVDGNSPVSRDMEASIYADILKNGANEGRSAADPVMKKAYKNLDDISNFDPVKQFFDKYNSMYIGGVKTNDIFRQGSPWREAIEKGRFPQEKIQGEYFAAKAKAEAPTPFKDFYRRAQVIWDAHPDDFLSSELKSHVGDFIAKVDPEFAKLQNEYRIFASHRNKFRDIMKPFEGPAYTEGGEQLFKRVFEGKTTGTDKEALHFLEHGFKGEHLNIKGMGKVGDPFRQLNERLTQYEKHLEAIKDTDTGLFSQRLTNIARQHAGEIQKLTEANQLTDTQFQEKILKATNDVTIARDKMLEDLFNRREVLRKRREKLGKIDATAKKVEGVANALTYALKATGFYHVSWAVRGALALRKAAMSTSRMSRPKFRKR